MKMNEQELARFNATAGAHSIVTAREAGHDKSITLDRYEREVIELDYTDFCRRVGGANIGDPRKAFYVNNMLAYLSIKYPKTNKTELRLYMSRAYKFYGKEGDVFYVYRSDDYAHPVVGFMTQEEWNEQA